MVRQNTLLLLSSFTQLDCLEIEVAALALLTQLSKFNLDTDYGC